MIARIKSDNFNGKSVNITFTPDTGGTININNVVIPYDYSTDYPYGSYSIEVIGEGITCPLEITSPVGTPTPTPTTTATPTPTITPTATPTPTPTPFVATASISPTGATQYYDVILTGSTNITSPTYIWSLTGFTDTSGNTISSYTGQTLIEGYFSSTGSSNVLLTITGDNTLYPGNAVSATTTNFEVEVQDPFISIVNRDTNDLIYSTDAINWSGTTLVIGNSETIEYGNRTILFGRGDVSTSNRVAYLTTGITTTLGGLTSSSVRLYEINYASWNNTFFTGIYDGTQQYSSSDNGLTWSANTSLPFGRYTSTTDDDNEQLLLVRDNGALYTSSDNGLTYSATTPFTDSEVHPIIRNKTLGYTIATVRIGGKTYISEDNITWSGYTTSNDRVWNHGLTYRESDGRTLIVSYLDNNGLISDDGVNWSGTTLPDIDGNYYLTCVHVPAPVDLFVAVSRTGKVVTSPDGFTWTQRTQTLNVDAFEVDYGYRQG